MAGPRTTVEAQAFYRMYHSYADIPNPWDRLRWCRYGLDLLQKEVAAMVGMEEWLYRDLESGAFHRSFTPELADKLAAFYSIPVKDLLDDYALPGDQDDLISIGTIGLMKAVDTFDSARRTRFSTYASRCIENELRMQFRRERKTGGTVSLQETLESDEASSLTLADVLQDSFCMEEVCEKQAEIRRARLLLDGLPARERQIILLRYGLAGQPPLTQLEVAGLLNISRSYVSRLETHALELLRQRWNAPDTKTAQR